MFITFECVFSTIELKFSTVELKFSTFEYSFLLRIRTFFIGNKSFFDSLFFFDNPIADSALGAIKADTDFYQPLALCMIWQHIAFFVYLC